SWRILVEDFNIAWAQHHSGQSITLPTGGTSFQHWATLLKERAHTPATGDQTDIWNQIGGVAAALPAPHPETDTYASAGHLTVSLDADMTRRLLTEVPAAFHTGVQEVLLIAYA
ncbi:MULTISPECIES: condensation domain-containing protein, partial [unclassified Mycobacterium]|uniref:condensation domain-containing protein n=1 Tax=unclassified Mycobacterium TaxID=2642494 RepID=UPI0012E29AAF